MEKNRITIRIDEQTYLYKEFMSHWTRDSFPSLHEIFVYKCLMPLRIHELEFAARQFLDEVYKARNDKTFDMDKAIKDLLGDGICHLKNYPFSNPVWLFDLLDHFEASDAIIQKYIDEWDKHYLCPNAYEEIGIFVRTGTFKGSFDFIKALLHLRWLEDEAIKYSLQAEKNG